MTDEKQQRKKSLAERAKELVQDILEALEDLVPVPQPELIPIPIPIPVPTDRSRRRP